MELLRGWITGIAAAAIIVSVASTLAPKNVSGKLVKLAGAAMLIMAVISPIKKLHIENLAPYTVRYNLDYENIKENLSEENQRIQALIIEDKMSTYILQRAHDIGVNCQAKVTAGLSEDGYLYPESVAITLDPSSSEGKRLELSEIIEKECAIPDKRQMFYKK